MLYPGEVESYRQTILGDNRVCVFAFFDRDEILEAIGEIGPVEVYVVGQFKSGQYFYGSDTIRFISPGRRLPKFNIRNLFKIEACLIILHRTNGISIENQLRFCLS